jgi:hypothetical protein
MEPFDGLLQFSGYDTPLRLLNTSGARPTHSGADSVAGEASTNDLHHTIANSEVISLSEDIDILDLKRMKARFYGHHVYLVRTRKDVTENGKVKDGTLPQWKSNVKLLHDECQRYEGDERKHTKEEIREALAMYIARTNLATMLGPEQSAMELVEKRWNEVKKTSEEERYTLLETVKSLESGSSIAYYLSDDEQRGAVLQGKLTNDAYLTRMLAGTFPAIEDHKSAKDELDGLFGRGRRLQENRAVNQT